MILDWKSLAGEIYNELSSNIEQLEKKPCLGAILVWDSSASLRYISQKQKFSEKIGMQFQLFKFPEEITEEELLEEIQKLNHDNNISWYIVQLPLPDHIDPLRIIRNIDPKKDVDGFHPENQGKIMIWDPTGLSPCTPAGVMKIFSAYNISLEWKNVAMIGQSNIVGKPMAIMCINAWSTVSSCNHMTDDISIFTKNADIIITATGQAKLIHPDNVRNNAIIIDVWFSVVDGVISGDADTKALLENGNTITPVPGWVGPMTVAMLLSNTYKAHINMK